MSHSIFKEETLAYSLAVFGKQIRLGRNPETNIRRAIKLGADPNKICLVYAPSGPGMGFRLLKLPDYSTPIEAEGVWLSESGSAALIASADCPIVMLHNTQDGNIALFHAGRSALSPPASGCVSCEPTVVENALPHLLRGASPAVLEATIVASICGQCFKHEQAEHLIASFDRLSGAEDIFFNRALGQLDLQAVIRFYLKAVGVLEENIHSAPHCTLEHPRLSSHRAGHKKRNVTIVVKH